MGSNIMETNIRFIKIKDSRYYSIKDVEAYLRNEKAISLTRNMSYFFEDIQCKKFLKTHANYYSTIQIKPFDSFFNWSAFGDVYKACLPSEKNKITKTQVLDAIDCNVEELIKRYHPEFNNIFIEVQFTETKVTE